MTVNTNISLPRFTAANRAALEALRISYVAPANPHRPGTPTYEAFVPFIGTEGMNLWDLWKSGRNPAHLAYRLNRGIIRVAAVAAAPTVAPEAARAAAERTAAFFARAAASQPAVTADPLGEAAFAAMAAEHGIRTTRRGRRGAA